VSGEYPDFGHPDHCALCRQRASEDDRCRVRVAEMCPYRECYLAGKCQMMGSYEVPNDTIRFCRLRPPLDKIAGASQ
jgi:hypothetical protein